MELRKFNEDGLRRFAAYLRDLKQGGAGLAFSPDDAYLTEVIPGGAEVELRAFENKLDFARYFQSVTRGKVSPRTLRENGGIWAWLCYYYLDQVCPRQPNGERKILRVDMYIASGAHVAYGPDKHLLYFPWKLYQVHAEDAAWLLRDKLETDVGVLRELANSYRRNVSPPYLRLAKLLYYDPSRDRFRTGATSKKEAPGTLRRLDRVMKQLDMTYDVFGMDERQLMSILPQPEFTKWIRHAWPTNPSSGAGLESTPSPPA